MNQITIQIGNTSRDIDVPEGWNDLDLRSLLLFYATLFTKGEGAHGNTLFTTVKIISMAQSLLKMSFAEMAQWEADCFAEDEEFGDLIFLKELRTVVHEAIGGLFYIEAEEETQKTSYEPKLNLTKNPWSHFTNTENKGKADKTTWLYAPADGLSNITLYELAFTFTLFENYLSTQDDALANRLIAALYRPSRPETKAERESEWFGDRRIPLRKYEKTLDKRAEQVASLPMLTRRVILFWFASCRQAIIDRHPKVFFRADGDRSQYGWGGVMLAMADGPVGLEAIADQPYSNGLMWLSMKEDERRRLEASAAKKRQ